MSRLTQKLGYQGTFHLPDTPALNVTDVSVAFASLPIGLGHPTSRVNALEKVTFQAKSGEQLAIIGPNGAGKSTLLKVIAGILTPDSGAVSMFGHAPAKHVCIAYVPQSSTIDWRFPVTVTDVVMMGRTKQIGLFRRPKKADYEIVAHCLERVGLDHLGGRQIGELSGGQRQRVFIARALALETNLLLMDEPLAGLDGPSQAALFAILADLRPDDVTVLVATHDLNLVAERFDRVMLLNRGIVAIGPPAAVLNTANLLATYGGRVTPPSATSSPEIWQHEPA